MPVPANPYNPGWELLRPLKVVSTGDMVVIADDDADPFSRAASKIQANFRGRKARAAGLASLAAASAQHIQTTALEADSRALRRTCCLYHDHSHTSTASECQRLVCLV